MVEACGDQIALPLNKQLQRGIALLCCLLKVGLCGIFLTGIPIRRANAFAQWGLEPY